MKKILLINILSLIFTVQVSARNASVLVCENDYGEDVEFSYDFSGENIGHFSQDIYDDCFYEESLMRKPNSNLDDFISNLKIVIQDDAKFMLLCMSHSVGASTFIYAYEDKYGAIKSKKGDVLVDDDSVEVTGSPNCYDDY